MSTAPRVYTPDEYLALERAAEHRSEYVDGRIYAMRGATPSHSSIGVNVIAGLHAALRGGPCRTYNADMRVRVGNRRMYTYPDVSAVCGSEEFEDDETDVLLNPSLVVEVLSRSTERYDRSAKFERYRTVASLREYVLIAQDRVHVERYRRTGDSWLLTAYDDVGDAVELASVGATLALRDVYEHVDFVERPGPRVVRETPGYAYAEHVRAAAAARA